uniref:Uncharacterized protein n=1 Tax=Anguilla anguilla TaxID=7936 RepID=A0A0E9XDK8_ANGAN
MELLEVTFSCFKPQT